MLITEEIGIVVCKLPTDIPLHLPPVASTRLPNLHLNAQRLKITKP